MKVPDSAMWLNVGIYFIFDGYKMLQTFSDDRKVIL